MFDFIGNTLSRGLDKNGELLDTEEKALNPFPHGPQRFRSVSNGQIRRLQVRRAESQKRKTNRRFRRDWMKNERSFVVLQQQLRVVAALPLSRGGFMVDQPVALMKNVHEHLEAAYGSVDKALDYFRALEAERA